MQPFQFLAGSTGLEPAASGVTGRRYNQLNYDPCIFSPLLSGVVHMVGGTRLELVTPGL